MGATGSLSFESRGKIAGGIFFSTSKNLTLARALSPDAGMRWESQDALDCSVYTSALFIFFKKFTHAG